MMTNNELFDHEFIKYCIDQGLDSKVILEKLELFSALLLKWNEVYNLTAIRQKEKVWTEHILDSLGVYSCFKRLLSRKNITARILDVGTGPGLPGIPLALMFPMHHFVLVDSVYKKISFIRQALIELGLKNVEVLHERVEALKVTCFDVVISRAFSQPDHFISVTRHIIKDDGVWVYMKGAHACSDVLVQDIRVQTYPMDTFGRICQRELLVFEQ